MVLIPASTPYCMDETEVTQDAYQDFLARSPDPNDQVAVCVGQQFTPTCGDFQPFNTPLWPVNCVDWCDARAYCSFFGKRLCGRIGGGVLAAADGNDAALSEWFNACSNGGATAYPYGPAHQSALCYDITGPSSDPSDVDTKAACDNDQGVVHLSGNVREWEDACTGGACNVRGGSWIDGPNSAPHTSRCNSAGTQALTESNDKTGFRCCADAN